MSSLNMSLIIGINEVLVTLRSGTSDVTLSSPVNYVTAPSYRTHALTLSLPSSFEARYASLPPAECPMMYQWVLSNLLGRTELRWLGNELISL